jgi:hypothetical protein
MSAISFLGGVGGGGGSTVIWTTTADVVVYDSAKISTTLYAAGAPTAAPTWNLYDPDGNLADTWATVDTVEFYPTTPGGWLLQALDAIGNVLSSRLISYRAPNKMAPLVAGAVNECFGA